MAAIDEAFVAAEATCANEFDMTTKPPFVDNEDRPVASIACCRVALNEEPIMTLELFTCQKFVGLSITPLEFTMTVLKFV
jgi:hypothetical protein